MPQEERSKYAAIADKDIPRFEREAELFEVHTGINMDSKIGASIRAPISFSMGSNNISVSRAWVWESVWLCTCKLFLMSVDVSMHVSRSITPRIDVDMNVAENNSNAY